MIFCPVCETSPSPGPAGEDWSYCRCFRLRNCFLVWEFGDMSSNPGTDFGLVLTESGETFMLKSADAPGLFRAYVQVHGPEIEDLLRLAKCKSVMES